MKLLDVIKGYSREALVEKLITAKTLNARDTLKGQLLAYSDFETILKVYEEKDLEKLRAYLEVFDVYADNLNLFINVTEPRQEMVLLSKIDTLKKIKSKMLKYVERINGQAGRINGQADVSGVHSQETQEDKSGEGATTESAV